MANIFSNDPTGNNIIEDSNIDQSKLNEDFYENETELMACQRRLKTCKKLLIKCQKVIEEEQLAFKQIQNLIKKENLTLTQLKEALFFLLKNFH